MNRAILLIICDFLLISLLALARFDTPEEEPETPPEDVADANGEATDDLVELLKLSLENEESQREQLSAELEARDEALLEREEQLAERDESLDKTVEELEMTRAEAEALERERERLAEESRQLASLKEELEADREELSANLNTTRTRLSTLEQDSAALARELADAREEAAINRERLSMTEEELQEREEEIARREAALAALEQEKTAVEREAANLQTELRVRSTEKEILEQNLLAAKSEIETVRVEKQAIQQQTDRLTEGVAQLAERSNEITEEIRQSQPKTTNTIFTDFRDNRITVTFETEQSGFGGTRTRQFPVRTLLATDGERTFALFHEDDTPFRFSDNPPRYDSLSGRMTIGDQTYRIDAVSFLTRDPRVMAVRVPPEAAREAGIKIFDLTKDPFRFPEAVLISQEEAYYGEAPFQLADEAGQYLEMQSRIFSRLFGEFSPSSGDLVFAKSGELIGLMIDNDRGVLIDQLAPVYELPIGSGFDSEETRRFSRNLNARASR